MKTFSICCCYLAIASIIFSCSKDAVKAASPQPIDFGSRLVEYDPSYPLAGDWVLKYSNGATPNIHTDYPQDNNVGYYTWASHLSLLKNDSAYWNSWGIDAMPITFFPGSYSFPVKASNLAFINFNFSIYSDSVFEYSLKDKDTLLLKTLLNAPTVYTYARK